MQDMVVVALETTGLYNSDRVVEVGAIRIDSSGRTVSEFTTLVNPLRDVGPTSIHGITASMVAEAPTFEEIAVALAAILDDAVLVAHNASFDERMLGNELDRLDAHWDLGSPLCTMRWAATVFGCGRSLAACCEAAQLVNDRPHSALDDAHATAELLRSCLTVDGLDRYEAARPVDADVEPGWPNLPRTWRRSSDFVPAPSYLAGLVAHVRAGAPADWAYLALVDGVLADLVVTPAEASALLTLAHELGYEHNDVTALHDEYFDALVEAALRDHVVHDDELEILERAATALGVDPAPMRARIAEHRPTVAGRVTSIVGRCICFTGDWDGEYGGQAWSRSLAHELTTAAGGIPVENVTKRTDLLVAADVSSASSKAKKARQYGIPVISIPDFLALL